MPQALENYNIVASKNPGFIMAHYFMGNVFNDADQGQAIPPRVG